MNDNQQMPQLKELTGAIIGAAIKVHKALGPGLLGSAYEACLAYELDRAGLKIERQKPLPLVYEDVKLDCGYRMDILVEGKVIIETKAVEKLMDIHKAQMISYLRLSGCKVGLILNFNVEILVSGVMRVSS
jgi:GxxExxY protein